MARVSVCIPSYNYAHFIGATIQSALDQTYGDLEVVVVDNCSTDDTEKVVGAFASEQVRFYRNEQNIGFVRNLNRCLVHARGEYVIFPGADDLLYPECLAKQVAFMDAHPEAAFVFTGGYVIDKTGKPMSLALNRYAELTPGPEAFKRLMASCNDILMPSVLVRRALLEKAGGFNEELDYSPDYEAWVKLCLFGDVGYLDEPLVGYRMHDGNLTLAFVGGGGQLKDLQRLVEAIFRRPEVQAQGLASCRELADGMLARYVLDNVFFYRMKGGRRLVLENVRHSLRLAPGQLLKGRFWVRLGASLVLPRRVFESRQRKKAEAALEQVQNAPTLVTGGHP